MLHFFKEAAPSFLLIRKKRIGRNSRLANKLLLANFHAPLSRMNRPQRLSITFYGHSKRPPTRHGN